MLIITVVQAFFADHVGFNKKRRGEREKNNAEETKGRCEVV